ncbi:MAG: hypothetical protein JNM10_11615 [Planctomycetia bacterium]|nr:hypothetical protein [Planctomycetia bacterium]
MYVGDLTPVPAYGPRATRDEAGVGASGPRGFRVRFSLVAAQVVAACFTVAYVSVLVRAAVLIGAPGRLIDVVPVAFVAIPLALASGYAVSSALTYLLAPMLRTEDGRLHWRRAFPARVATFEARELVWRPGTGYVGTHLVTRRDGTERRIPLWMLSRARQRELFAWLDANVPPAKS